MCGHSHEVLNSSCDEPPDLHLVSKQENAKLVMIVCTVKSYDTYLLPSMKRRSAVGPEWMLPSSSTGEQYSSPLFSKGLKMFLKDSASVRPRTDSGRAERKAKCTPACKVDISTWASMESVMVQMRW